ncbi:hypothetical protein HCN51_46075 [Nonomuraea sp. FMUSA5-5]|uniref:Uncharacterized protein n=1 Tax=Nonomuraea composti TaxID=2720023 RepID=A0ABX1BJL2_9ACTN|nr:hypothetical protein [Nonomuraea sp. FMUSA5-5]NJP96719.1 hypothetical protein [Nonomuraea sp. FMUSA5-5]
MRATKRKFNVPNVAGLIVAGAGILAVLVANAGTIVEFIWRLYDVYECSSYGWQGPDLAPCR